jgi:FixJ family two-component response regulator/signal transduction histidine kinase
MMDLYQPGASAQRAEALLAGEKRLLEMIARGCSLPVVLDGLCQLVEDTASGCHCSIVLLDPSGTKVQKGAAPSLPASYNEAIDGWPVTREAGPCGMAACLKTQVIVPDIAADTRWDASGWRTLALDHGLRSCWSTPILSLAGKVLGTFALYQHEPGSPTPLQLDLIEQFTHIASIAIERAQNEAALKRSEAFLAKAQRLSSTGSFSWCLATGEITWSEQTYRIYEIDPAVPATFELVGARIHPEERQWFQELVEQAQREGKDLEFEHRLQMPDLSVKWLHVVAHGTRGQDGRLEYIGAVQDVTERRRSEDALSKLRSELAHVARVGTLGALTASIAHEVNQPLSGIITNAGTCLRMLAENPPNIEGASETARRTIRDGNRAAEVIARLRSLFEKKGTTAESVDLNEATREVIALSWSEIQRAQVILRMELADDLPVVQGDRVQLQQVVLNLLLNAAEAMSGVEDRPRHLVVRTEHEGDRVRLTVQDSGPGFDPQDLDRLFEAFYTTKQNGMGIGLSVSRSIIESHQGRLWAAPNEGPGAGFSFSLPRPAERVTPIVFVVDDDVSVRESLELLIRWAGWTPETFSSAQEFLARPAVDVPSCLVLDVRLPDLNGLDLQQRLAADRRDMSIIFMTGYGDVPMTVQAMKAGAVEFLTKPFANEVLLNAIRQGIERSRAALGEAAEIKALRERYASLTQREREVMAWVVAGLLNKQVGIELGTSEITVKAHRGKVMRKMKADSLAYLVRTAARLDLPIPTR